MLLIFGGYVLVAVAFYTYVVTTAQEEPKSSEIDEHLPVRHYKLQVAKAHVHAKRTRRAA